MTIKYQMRAFRTTPTAQGFVYWTSDFSPDNDGSIWEAEPPLPAEPTRNKSDLINISINRSYPENLSAMFPANSVIYTNSAGALMGATIPSPPVDYKVLMQKGGNIVFESVNSDMVASGFDITSFQMTSPASTPGDPPFLLLEVGDVINHPSFSASYNGTPTSVHLSFDGGTPSDFSSTPTNISLGSTFTYNSNTEKEFSLIASYGAVTKSKTIQVKWFHKVYYGTGPYWSSISNKQAFVTGLTGSIQKDLNTTFIPTLPTSGAYVYFACPQSYGAPTFSVGGWPGGFNAVDAINIAVGALNIMYDVWISEHSGSVALQHNVSSAT